MKYMGKTTRNCLLVMMRTFVQYYISMIEQSDIIRVENLFKGV